MCIRDRYRETDALPARVNGIAYAAREARLVPLGQNAHAANQYRETDALPARVSGIAYAAARAIAKKASAAVSYTHLDVYKRQGCRGGSPSEAC